MILLLIFHSYMRCRCNLWLGSVSVKHHVVSSHCDFHCLAMVLFVVFRLAVSVLVSRLVNNVIIIIIIYLQRRNPNDSGDLMTSAGSLFTYPSSRLRIFHWICPVFYKVSGSALLIPLLDGFAFGSDRMHELLTLHLASSFLFPKVTPMSIFCALSLVLINEW